MTRKRQQTRNEKIIAYVLAVTKCHVTSKDIRRVQMEGAPAIHPSEAAIARALEGRL